jgi:hypothetical protein
VSTPGDGPQYNPYGQPGQYRAGQQPGQYTSGPPQGQGYPQPYPAPGQPPHGGYDPYGGAAASSWEKAEPEPVKRPGLMVPALVLMVLAALPFLVGGVAALFTVTVNDIPAEVLDDARVVAAGGTPALILQALQLLLGLMAVVALGYLLLAVLAFRGRNWARIVLAVLTAGFVLLLLTGLVGGGVAGGVLGFVVFLLVATVGGVAILFTPDANRFFARPR